MKTLLFLCGLICVLAFAAHAQTCDVQPVKLVIPPYPVVALASKESGRVVVRVTVDKEGDVLRAESTEGPKWLSKSAEEVAKIWKFSGVKASETLSCKTRSADLTFDFVILPAGTSPSEETRPYVVLPFHVTVQQILGTVTINPTHSPSVDRGDVSEREDGEEYVCIGRIVVSGADENDRKLCESGDRFCLQCCGCRVFAQAG